MTIEEVTAKTLESKLDFTKGLTACWQALRRGATTLSAKSTAIAQHLAARAPSIEETEDADFEMSKQAK